jgi:hypothetical protein
MIRTIALSSALLVALTGIALAQDAPTVAASPAGTSATGAPSARAERGAVFALRGAYRAIAEAQVTGASPYLDAAKTHYRNAIARYARHDAGAAAEAMAATALARAAAAEHPAPMPRDIPAPPQMTAMAPPAGGVAMAPGGMRRAPMGHGGWQGRGGMGGRFDATALAHDASLANTPEAKDLAQKALDADLARTRAAFSGNADESMREGRLASELALAVRSLARADHPPTRQRRTPNGRSWSHQPRSSDGIVGGATES